MCGHVRTCDGTWGHVRTCEDRWGHVRRVGRVRIILPFPARLLHLFPSAFNTKCHRQQKCSSLWKHCIGSLSLSLSNGSWDIQRQNCVKINSITPLSAQNHHSTSEEFEPNSHRFCHGVNHLWLESSNYCTSFCGEWNLARTPQTNLKFHEAERCFCKNFFYLDTVLVFFFVSELVSKGVLNWKHLVSKSV